MAGRRLGRGDRGCRGAHVRRLGRPQNFLLRSFDVRVKGKPALTGTQRIGWDPLTKQIKSWVFDSTGGYGEGLWMRQGDQWVIKATGVRPSGRTTTATQVLSRASAH